MYNLGGKSGGMNSHGGKEVHNIGLQAEERSNHVATTISIHDSHGQVSEFSFRLDLDGEYFGQHARKSNLMGYLVQMANGLVLMGKCSVEAVEGEVDRAGSSLVKGISIHIAMGMGSEESAAW